MGAHTAWTHGKLTIYQGDVMALTREQVPGLGAIWDRGALVALPETMRASYAPHLRSLMDGGRVLLNSLYYGPCEKKGPPHSISQQMLEQLYPAAHLDRVIHRDDSDGIRDTWREMGMTELFIDVWRIELG